MGDTIWLDVQGLAEDDLPSDNSIMLRLEKRLDNLSSKLGVSKLTDFYDYSEIEGEFDDLAEAAGREEHQSPAESGERAKEQGVWFDPGPALNAVRAIREHLAKHPQDLGFKPDASREHWPSDLMEELEHCQSVLERAASNGKRFRLLIVA